MHLISLSGVSVSVGGPALLEGADLTLGARERIAVIGRNGEGKSTLLRVLAGELVPEDGRVVRAPTITVRSLPQEVPRGLTGSVRDVLAAGAGELGAAVADYHRRLERGEDPASTPMIARHERIDAAGGWDLAQAVDRTLSRLALDGDAAFATLSGGYARRVLVARALVAAPDVLLLDEPTNHLDIPTIEWLEELLARFAGTIVFVTHDRRFLRALATRIVELDRGRLTSWPGDLANYLRRRDERLHAEDQARAEFDRRLAAVERWIRQGIKARRTRNEGRVRALEAMRRQRGRRREQPGTVALDVAEAGRSGRRVIVAEDIDVERGGRTILRGVSTTILRGDRVGLIGPNGAGKTTLLQTLLGRCGPSRGTVTLGTQLEIAYFDQHREALREDWTAVANVADGQEFVTVDGRRRHAIGHLRDFLFTPERARAPITRLSGGERNRLLLARLFARPSNLLVLDEPTNDLDVETLELLEEQLAAYTGTLLLVSHDRDFLDAVVTSTLAIGTDGRVVETVGGYTAWEERARREGVVAAGERRRPVPASGGPHSNAPGARSSRRSGKLSYRDQRELDALPARIEALEAELADLSGKLGDAGFYQLGGDAVADATRRVAVLEAELTTSYERWEALEDGG